MENNIEKTIEEKLEDTLLEQLRTINVFRESYNNDEWTVFISAMKAAYNLRGEEDKWISVKQDGFPHEYGEYIICDESGIVGVAYFEEVGEVEMFHRDDYDEFKHGNVTHWQPLPEKPKTI